MPRFRLVSADPISGDDDTFLDGCYSRGDADQLIEWAYKDPDVTRVLYAKERREITTECGCAMRNSCQLQQLLVDTYGPLGTTLVDLSTLEVVAASRYAAACLGRHIHEMTCHVKEFYPRVFPGIESRSQFFDRALVALHRRGVASAAVPIAIPHGGTVWRRARTTLLHGRLSGYGLVQYSPAFDQPPAERLIITG